MSEFKFLKDEFASFLTNFKAKDLANAAPSCDYLELKTVNLSSFSSQFRELKRQVLLVNTSVNHPRLNEYIHYTSKEIKPIKIHYIKEKLPIKHREHHLFEFTTTIKDISDHFHSLLVTQLIGYDLPIKKFEFASLFQINNNVCIPIPTSNNNTIHLNLQSRNIRITQRAMFDNLYPTRINPKSCIKFKELKHLFEIPMLSEFCALRTCDSIEYLREIPIHLINNIYYKMESNLEENPELESSNTARKCVINMSILDLSELIELIQDHDWNIIENEYLIPEIPAIKVGPRSIVLIVSIDTVRNMDYSKIIHGGAKIIIKIDEMSQILEFGKELIMLRDLTEELFFTMSIEDTFASIEKLSEHFEYRLENTMVKKKKAKKK